MPAPVPPRRPLDERFRGHILGVGTTSGHRFVVGVWQDSPFGRFTDVFVERPDGSSVLLAPDASIASYVSRTYRFDETQVVPVEVRRRTSGLDVVAGPLRLGVSIGGITLLGRLLRVVPRVIATDPRWLGAINPIARLIVPGAGTAGSAGGGRREYYGVTGAHAIAAVEGTWDGADLGLLARLDPPVRFGFASMPATPQIVDVETVIRTPGGARTS
jgi:hypothetical protein